MPFSQNTFDDWIGRLIKMLDPETVLDIGAGAGKYGRLIKRHAPEAQSVGLEIDQDYIIKYKLSELYSSLLFCDALDLLKEPKIRFDLVIMGDVIEHLRKSDGVDLLNFLIYRSGYICVVYPHEYVQDEWGSHAQEAHISTWSVHDFLGWSTIHKRHDNMHLYLIKGYQSSKMIVGD